MQAIINLSGEGSLVMPLDCDKSAAFLDVCGEKIGMRMLNALKGAGADNIIIITGERVEAIKEGFREAGCENIKLEYIEEFSSDGDLRKYIGKLEDDFIYMTKLVYTDFDLSEAVSFHISNRSSVTIVTKSSDTIGYSGRVSRLEEGRIWRSIAGGEGLGIYIVKKSVMSFMPEEGVCSFEKNVLPAVVRAGKRVYTKPLDGVCERLGDTNSYLRMCVLCAEGMKNSRNKGIVVSKGAIIEEGARLEAPVFIAGGAHIHEKSRVGAYSVIGEGSVVLRGASIERSVVGKGCHVGKNAVLRGCIVDDRAQIGENARINEQAVIGGRSIIGENSVVRTFVKIWPERNVDKNDDVKENITWGFVRKKCIFEKGRIRGAVNAGITASFCTRLGECVGALFMGGDVGISTDASPAAVMIRDAICAGLASCGCAIKDFGEQPLPITRRGTVFYMLRGAVCVSAFDIDGEEVAEITIINKDGLNLEKEDKKRLEELFKNDDFVCAEGREIKECEYLFEYKLYYLKSIVGYKKKTKRERRLLLSCAAAWGRRLIASSMADFGVSVSMCEPVVKDDYSNAAQFESAVKEGGFDMGFILDGKCEKLRIVLPDVTIFEETYESLASLIIMKKYPGAKIYVPLTAPGAIEKMAEKYECRIIRAETSQTSLMKHLAGEEKYLAEEFALHFDAVAAAVTIMAYLIENDIDLYALLEEIPAISMARTIVDVRRENFDEAIMKVKRMPEAEGINDGVRISFDKGWVVVIPDAEKEVFEVVGEGLKAETARELCDICIEKIVAEN